MYLGIDIGGTKTLAVVLDENGVIVERDKFPTPDNYDEFLIELKNKIEDFECKDFIAAGVAVPSTKINRETGVAVTFGNLSWVDIPIASDISEIANCPVMIENDAKLAGLSEAMLLKDEYSKIMYLTLSTGVGYAIIDKKEIDIEAGDGGGRTILINRNGEELPWEDVASGKALFTKYGQMAKDIDDKNIWREYCHEVAEGLVSLIGIFQPEVIVIGGSVGTHFEKYGDILTEEVAKYDIPKVIMPVILGAQRPEDAVAYGCYDLVKKKY